jgi:HAD superfamily hydrolase (TIGR01509 family)
MGLIIDLDLTLIDSQQAEPLRKKRQWQNVYSIVPQLRPYEGITELLLELNQLGVPICIVTSSPEPYCNRIIAHWKWVGIKTVCFYDTKRRKPYPDPILLALKRINVRAEDAILVGDDPKDIIASKTAGVYAVGALWGTLNRQTLIEAQPDTLCETVSDLRALIFSRFELGEEV